MPAVLNIGHNYYFFTSTANAAKVADLLHKATEVSRDYKTAPDTYRELGPNDYSHVIEMTMTRQQKPASSLKALPESVTSNNEYYQSKNR